MWTGGFHKYEHLHTVVSYIFTKKNLNIDLNMMLTDLMEFCMILDIYELHSRFDEYLAI